MSAATEQRPFAGSADALQLSQKAPVLLAKSSSISSSLPLSLVGPAESPELWTELVQLFYACLRTGDDKSAHLCLEKLTQRFGADNHKVMGMRGLYQEAVAEDDNALKKILQEYNKVLNEDPMNMPLHKRRIALVRAIGGNQEAIACLTDLLNSFPSDVEGWCELSDLYQSQGLSSQAIYCLEEALLTVPNAWNLHARLGELEYMTGSAANEGSEPAIKSLVMAVQRFSRSIELCDDYLRGYYGLKLAVGKLLGSSAAAKSTSNPISTEKLQRLDQLATSRLRAIIQERNSAVKNDTKQAEVIAAQELLDRAKS